MNFGAHKKSLSMAYDKKTERLFPENSQISGTFLPHDFMPEKHKSEIQKQIRKYEESRKRDFTSQIKTIPGPKNITYRPLHEQKSVWKKKFDLRETDNQAFVSNIDRMHKKAPIPKSHPSFVKHQQPLDTDNRRKGYQLK